MGDDGTANVLRALREALSLEAVWALEVEYFASQGFDAVAYLIFDKGGVDNVVAFLDHGFAPEVITRFAALGYGKHAPLLRIAMATGEPQLGTEIGRRHTFSREELDHREAMFSAGLAEALAFPLYGPMGREAIVFVAEASSPDRYEQVDRAALHMVAQFAHLRALSVSANRNEMHSLSRREVEILRWVAQGKSNSVIAEIVGISTGTVDTYLRRTFDKLDVADRTSAAVKGVSLGLIRA